MANREKGETALSIAGTTYTLVLDIEGTIALEDLFSTPQRDMFFPEILEKVNLGGVKYIRGFVWAALQKYHPDITLQRAGELIQDAGGLLAFGEQLQAVALAAIPDPVDVEALGANGQRPRKAQARKRRGIGEDSISSIAASA